MSLHCTIDLETLGVSPDSVILTLGAVKFNIKDGSTVDELYLRINVDQQLDQGRVVDENTLKWWGEQDKDVMFEALNPDGRIGLEDAVHHLNKFLVGVSKIWCQGAGFDSVILEHLYRSMKKPIPWQYWQIQDSRTLFNLLPEDPRKLFPAKLHNALDDCKSQTSALLYTFNKLGIDKNARVMG
jgi:hypothetical protein